MGTNSVAKNVSMGLKVGDVRVVYIELHYRTKAQGQSPLCSILYGINRGLHRFLARLFNYGDCYGDGRQCIARSYLGTQKSQFELVSGYENGV